MSQTAERIDFNDHEDIEVPVSFKGKKYLLLEASGEASRRFQNKSISGARLEDGKVSGLSNTADAQFVLLAACIIAEEGRKPVDESVIKLWPHRMTKRLFERCKEISELDEDDSIEALLKQRLELDKRIAKIKEDAAKNVPESTTDGSD